MSRGRAGARYVNHWKLKKDRVSRACSLYPTFAIQVWSVRYPPTHR